MAVTVTYSYSCDFCAAELHDSKWQRADFAYASQHVFGTHCGHYCDWDCARNDLDRFAAGEHPKQQGGSIRVFCS